MMMTTVCDDDDDGDNDKRWHRKWNRVVHGSDGPAGRVGSDHDFARFWRVGSGRVGSALRIF